MSQFPNDGDAIQQRNALVEQWLWLAQTIAKHLMQRLPPCFDYEDLRQAGYLGLLNAAEKFDPARGVPFRSYATLRIRGEILESVRRRRWREATHLPITVDVLDHPDASVEAIERHVEHGEHAKLVAAAAEGLTDAERLALDIYYRREGKLAGVGAAFGIRDSRSSQVLQMARCSLIRELKWRGVATDLETGCTAEEMSEAAYDRHRAKRPRRRAQAA